MCVHGTCRMSEQEEDGGGKKAVELVFIERDVHPGLGIPGATLVTNGRGGQVAADAVHACMMRQRMYLHVQVKCGSCWCHTSRCAHKEALPHRAADSLLGAGHIARAQF
jgi:hypothetical protein